ncbi:MAG: energy-coupling factor transporter transmembrane component T [Rhodobacteraceae bacterium]|nr:energy-coupling factor transporter transmembrane component T [Paracoccaceae bacterium]
MLTLTSPLETPLHRLPAGLKLALLCAATVALFRIDSAAILAATAVALGALHLALGRPIAAAALRQLRPLWPFMALLALWNGWTGEVTQGVAIALRLVTAVACANLVTMTTRLTDMLAVLDRLVAPLTHLGLPTRRMTLAVALAIRFIPVLSDRIDAIRTAWSARSPRPPGWRILIPAALAALDEAEHVAEALRARGGAG